MKSTRYFVKYFRDVIIVIIGMAIAQFLGDFFPAVTILELTIKAAVVGVFSSFYLLLVFGWSQDFQNVIKRLKK